MAVKRTHGGNAFRNETMDTSKALGAKEPVVVDLTDFGGALREWVRGDARRLGLLKGIVAARRAHDGDDLASDDLEGPELGDECELAVDLSGFMLTRIPQVPVTEGRDAGDRDRVARMWAALRIIAGDHPGLFDLAGGTTAPVDDRPLYDEAEFWAAAERPRLRRPSRFVELDPDGARLAREVDLAPMLHPRPGDRATPLPGATPIVEVSDDGSELEFLVGRTLHVARDVRRRHLLVVGPTGCGKTTRAILPLIRGDIADPDLTVVVLDTKGELLPAVRVFGRESRPGQDVQVVQFRDPKRSLGWNPLVRVRDHSEALELAHNLCHAVEPAGASRDSVFWINNSIDLLAAFIVALKRKFGDEATIADALRLCDLSVRDLHAFAGEFDDLDALKRFASYVGSGSHNAETIVADLKMRLVLWRDGAVAATTSADEVDFEALCRTPSVVVLQVPEEDVEELKPVTNAWLDQLLSTALQTARDAPGLELPVHMSVYVEEFASSVGRIPKIERRLNTVRQPGISITASVQSIWQIADEYGTAFRSVMAGFSTKVVFPECLAEDAKWFSEQSGEAVFKETTITIEEDVRHDPLSLPKRIRTERPVVRSLLTSGQIQHTPMNQLLGRAVTWLAPGVPPFQAFLTPLFALEHGTEQLAAARELGARSPVRAEPLAWVPKTLVGGTGKPHAPMATQDGFTNTRGWSDEEVRERIAVVTRRLGVHDAKGSARSWWEAFEKENQRRLPLVLRLAEELQKRGSTVGEFFLSYVYSNTDNIQANLHYHDYRRLKAKEDEGKKKATAKAREKTPESARRAARASVQDATEELRGAAEPLPLFDVSADDGAGESREDQLRYWIDRMAEERWTYARAAARSGFTVGTLRYWRKRFQS